MEGSIERDGKVMLLAYDQGFEHGPSDFDQRNIDPAFIIKLAENGLFTGVIVHEGIAAKYVPPGYKTPVVIKLNGRTAFRAGEEPYSPALCTVEKAIELGAKGVGYTIYVGSEHEAKMMAEFAVIEDKAHRNGLTVIAWMYPRGAKVAGKENDRETVAYAARLGMELNADYVKITYPGSREDMEWVVKAAGKTGVLAQGGKMMESETLYKEVKEIMAAGARGLAIGRNVWQASNPDEVARRLAELVF